MKRSVMLLTLANFVALGAGFVREVTTAYFFGASAAVDAFSVTLLYVDGITAVVFFGLSGYMLVPVVARLTAEGHPEEGFRLMETMLLWLFAGGLPLLVVGMNWPRGLAQLIAPGFTATQSMLLADLLRLAIPSVLLITLAGILAGVLQARAEYYTPTFGRACLSLGVVATLALCAGSLGVQAGSIGLIIGATIQFLLLVGALFYQGWHPQFPHWRHPELRVALAAGLPTLLALVLSNILMTGGQRAFASSLPEGSLAAVNYAQRVLNLVTTLTMSLATVSLTELSAQYSAEGIADETRVLLKGSLESGIFLLTPLSFLLFICSEPIITLIFLRGEYNIQSLALTVSCLRWFSLTIIPGMLLAVLLRAYPAFRKPWHVAFISFIWMVATLTATVILLPWLGAMSLPAAYTFGTTVACIASVVGLWKMLGGALFQQIGSYLLRITSFSALAVLPTMALQGIITLSARSMERYVADIWLLMWNATLLGTCFSIICIIKHDPQMTAIWTMCTQVYKRVRKIASIH